ncbi:MFS transporter [Burkholderia sp. MR1-5-21]
MNDTTAMTASMGAKKAGTLQAVLLLLPITMAVMGLIVLVPVVPQMMQHFGAVPGVQFLIPLVLTLPALCVALLAPVAGVVVDRIGRRRTLIGALVLYAIAGIMPLFLDNLGAIIVSRVFVGAMESAVVTASTTLISDYFHGEAREKWLANQTALASISSIFLALLGGVLGNVSWRAPFAAYGISVLYAVGLLLWTWEPVKAEQPKDEIAGEGAGFPWSALMPLAGVAVFGGIMFFLMQIQVTNVLAEVYDIRSPGQLGMFTGTAGLSVAVGTVLFRRLARAGAATQLMVAFGLIGISYVMMNHSPAVSMFTGWLVVNQLGCGILLPSLVVATMASLPFEVRGRGTGVFMTAWWLGQPLSAQLAPWVRNLQGGSLPAALQVFGVICIVAAVITASRRRTRGGPSAAGEA